MDMQRDRYKEHFSDSFYVIHNYSLIPNRSFHCHDEFEITFFCSDDEDVFYINNGKRLQMRKHSVVFFTNMDIHMLQKNIPAACERCSIHFRPEFIIPYCTNSTNLLEIFYLRLSNMDATNYLHLTDEQAEEFFALFNELDHCRNYSDHKAYGVDVNSVILLARILLMLNRIYYDTYGLSAVTDSVRSSEKYMLLCKMLNFIQTNYSNPLNLDILSREFYTSKSQINLIFRSIIGITPTEYISNFRLRKAKELLLQNMPVEAVCFQCGYNNPSHFSHTFKQKEGISPKRYQSLYKTHRN